MISVDEANVRLAEEGYCVLEGLLDPAEANRLGELSRPLDEGARAEFLSSGRRTERRASTRVPVSASDNP